MDYIKLLIINDLCNKLLAFIHFYIQYVSMWCNPDSAQRRNIWKDFKKH